VGKRRARDAGKSGIVTMQMRPMSSSAGSGSRRAVRALGLALATLLPLASSVPSGGSHGSAIAPPGARSEHGPAFAASPPPGGVPGLGGGSVPLPGVCGQAPLDARELDAIGIELRGDPGLDALAVRRALARLLATEIGTRARAILAAGAPFHHLVVELNHDGENFTPYRVPGRELGDTIVFDPSTERLVETQAGPLPATLETILAHELGHALFKLRSEQAVIDQIENPVRAELGLPLRTRF
jgi:hypothetical protein